MTSLGVAISKLVSRRKESQLVLLGPMGNSMTCNPYPTGWRHVWLGTLLSSTPRQSRTVPDLPRPRVLQWLQITVPIRDGGLGVRRVSMLATSAYLASAASIKSLVSAILNKAEWGDAHRDELLEARTKTQPSSAESIWKQKMWDRPLIESDKAVVSS